MSINSISSGTQTLKSGGGPPPEIQAQLQKYGLSAQGSLQADLAAIQSAKQAQENQENQVQNTQNQQDKPPAGGGPPPELMAQLQQYGLQPTGSPEGDLAAIQKAKSEQSANTNNNPIAQMMEILDGTTNNLASNNSPFNKTSSFFQQENKKNSMSFFA